MKRLTQVVVAMVLLGILAGAAVAAAIPDQEVKCDRIENSIRQQVNASGALACFPPGLVSVNVSEPIEEGSEPICVCRRYLNGKASYRYIGRAASP